MVSRRTLLRAGAGAAGLAVAGVSSWTSTRPAAAAAAWDRLRRSFTGDIVLPGDPGYDRARQLDSKTYDHVRPRAIVYCETPQDVGTCLRFTQDHGWDVAVRSGGHSTAGYSTTPGVVLDVSRFDRIAPHGGTVTLGPGAQSVDIVSTLASSGLAAVTGNCPTVRAGGYLQGGGIGPTVRTFGVASDRMVAADVVLADGRMVRCSGEAEPDLFWALRGGGGGNFGVVTGYVVETAELPRVVSFSLSWPWSRAADVVSAYLPWLSQRPDELNASMTVMNDDAAPGSTPSIMVSGSWLGAPDGVRRHLDELVAAVGGKPAQRSTEDIEYRTAMMRMFGCSDKTVQQCHRVGENPEAMLPRQGYVVSRGELSGPTLSARAVDELLTTFESRPAKGQFRVMSWAGLGGRINRLPRGATAYVHRGAEHYLSFTAGLHSDTPTPEEKAAAAEWADAGFAVARRYGTGESHVNFVDARLRDWRRAYYAENYDRLVAVKNKYDPHGFFRFAQGVGS